MVFLGDEPADYYLSDLFAILSTVIASKPSEKIHVQEGQFENPLYYIHGMKSIAA